MLFRSVFGKSVPSSVRNSTFSLESSSGWSVSWPVQRDLHFNYLSSSPDAVIHRDWPSICVPRSNPLLPEEPQSLVSIRGHGYRHVMGKALSFYSRLVFISVIVFYVVRNIGFSSLQGFHLRYLEGVLVPLGRNSVSPIC